ncbi:hypothetical protein [Streptomyces sp. NPDC060065]|uniref:hypothetical protein n=1 Tax=Streptomyces sp. NPDC060065 TaxID=3347050 RepID=UPI0036CF57CB
MPLLAVATLLGGASLVVPQFQKKASAANGVSDVKGTQPGNSDEMIERLCSQERSSAFGYQGAYNVKTGDFLTWEQYSLLFGTAPQGDWETFNGECAYPESSSWTDYGPRTRVTQVQRNSGSSDDKYTFVTNFTTKETTKKSVGAQLGLSAAKSIFSGSAGGSFSYEWSFEKSETQEHRREISIPKCTEAWLDAIPKQRTVRVNPAFIVVEYKWDKGDGEHTVDTWRGRGPAWKAIQSRGYYIDGTANVMLPDGRVDMILDKQERKLDPRNCAS